MGYSNIPSFNEGEYCCAGNISMAKLNSGSTYSQPRAQFWDLSLPLFMAWAYHSSVDPMAENKAWGPQTCFNKSAFLSRLFRYYWRRSWTSLFVVYQSRLKIMYIKAVFYLRVSILSIFLTSYLSKPSRKSFQSEKPCVFPNPQESLFRVTYIKIKLN